jgi:hypothetical protein
MRMGAETRSKAGGWILALLLCSLCSIPARAQTESVKLDYAVTPGTEACPDAQAFRDAVAAHLGYDPFAASGKRTVRARIQKSGTRLSGTVNLEDDAGQTLGSKALESSQCDDLVSAMGFAVAMAIDPSRALHPIPPAPVSPPPTPALVEPPPPPPRAPPDESPPKNDKPRHRLIPQLSLGGAVAGLGPVANISAAIYAGAGLRYGNASLGLEGRYETPSSHATFGGQIETSTIGAALVPCAHWSLAFFCAELFLGALEGQSEGIKGNRSDQTFFSQAGVRLGVAIPLSFAPVSLEPFVEALVTLTPTEFNFLMQNNVWSTDAFGVSGGVRLVLHFP